MIAKAARAKMLVLYHQGAGEDDVGLSLLRDRLGIPVIRARDLDVFFKK